jgi:TldD protein
MDYDCCPIPRMTNTYLAPGNTDPAEIIRSADHGIYAVNFAGGQVDPATGKFTFSMSEAYVIEKGQVLYPIKGATLTGNCIDALKQVSMVGNDLAFDHGVGMCGKEGQSVRVGIGMPTVRLDKITVGGTRS